MSIFKLNVFENWVFGPLFQANIFFLEWKKGPHHLMGSFSSQKIVLFNFHNVTIQIIEPFSYQ